MCTSAETTFAWVGTVLINVGFLWLISWGAVTWWPLGAFLSGVYTVFLFSLSAWLDAMNQSRLQQEETRQRIRDGDYHALSATGTEEGIANIHADAGANANNVEVDNQGQGVATDPEPNTNTFTETSQLLPSRLSLMYGLAVVALGSLYSLYPSIFLPAMTVATDLPMEAPGLPIIQVFLVASSSGLVKIPIPSLPMPRLAIFLLRVSLSSPGSLTTRTQTKSCGV